MFKQYQLRKLQRNCTLNGLPDAFCSYLAKAQEQPGKQKSIHEARLVVFDTETTGLSIQRDRLLSIGAVVVQHGEIKLGDSFELLVNNEPRQSQQGSILVHGLRPSETRQGTAEAEAVMAFLDYVGPDILVAHHAAFDTGMVEQVMHRHLSPNAFLYNRVMDTATIARKLEHSRQAQATAHPAQSDFGLDSLCNRYHISQQDRHTAWGDALITAKLLLKLIYLFEKRGKARLTHFL